MEHFLHEMIFFAGLGWYSISQSMPTVPVALDMCNTTLASIAWWIIAQDLVRLFSGKSQTYKMGSPKFLPDTPLQSPATHRKIEVMEIHTGPILSKF